MAEAEADIAASGAAFDAGDAKRSLELLSNVRRTKENGAQAQVAPPAYTAWPPGSARAP